MRCCFFRVGMLPLLKRQVQLAFRSLQFPAELDSAFERDEDISFDLLFTLCYVAFPVQRSSSSSSSSSFSTLCSNSARSASFALPAQSFSKRSPPPNHECPSAAAPPMRGKEMGWKEGYKTTPRSNYDLLRGGGEKREKVKKSKNKGNPFELSKGRIFLIEKRLKGVV